MLNPTDKPQRVAVYCRVSSDEQAEANTIQNQVDYARRYLDLNGVQAVEFYLDEGVSGTIPFAEREQGRRLLADAKASKFDTVYVYRIDRFARRQKVLLDGNDLLQSLGVGLRSMTEPVDTISAIGRFLFQLMGSMAELDRETIVERGVLGTNRRAAEGKWLGGPVPMGYRVNKDRDLEIHQPEAEIVRLLYDLLLQGKSCFEIADYLNANNVPTWFDGPNKRKKRLASKWFQSRVHDMIRQSIYEGIHHYGRKAKTKRELIERAFPAIVSPETWEAAQRQLKANRIALSPQNAKRVYLLRGLVRCGFCGLTYVGGAADTSHNAYYRCNGKSRHRSKIEGRCPSKRVNADDLERDVWEQIVQWSHNPGQVIEQLRQQLQEGIKNQDSVRQDSERIARTLAQKERERDVIIRLLRSEEITYAEGQKHLAELAREIDVLQSQQNSLFEDLQAATENETRLLGVEALLEDLRERAKNAELETKRQLIQGLVKQITVNTVERGGKRTNEISVVFRFAAVSGTVRSSQDRVALEMQRVWVR